MFARLLANAAALIAAAYIVPGIHLDTSGDWTRKALVIGGVALVFGLVNSLVKPIVQLLSLPAVVLTLGLFLLVVNAAMLKLTAYVSAQFGLGFAVDSWLAALLGSIIISLVSGLVSGMLKGDR